MNPREIKKTSDWQFNSLNESPAKVAIIGPRWLQETFSVLLQSEDYLALVATAQTEDELFSSLDSPIPEIILLDADRRLKKAVEQITNIKTRLPSVSCLILADQMNQRQLLIEAGADTVILKGSPPSLVLEGIKEIAKKQIWDQKK